MKLVVPLLKNCYNCSSHSYQSLFLCRNCCPRKRFCIETFDFTKTLASVPIITAHKKDFLFLCCTSEFRSRGTYLSNARPLVAAWCIPAKDDITPVKFRTVPTQNYKYLLFVKFKYKCK